MKISGFEQRLGLTLARRAVACAVVAGSLLGARPSAAQPVDDATRNAARELAAQASEAFAKGDYDRALDLYHRAYALIPAPTLSLREARSLEKLGRWVEALEAYVRTTRIALGPDTPEAYRQAVHEAYEGLAKLRPRVPKLKVTLRGGDAAGTSVSLDGKPLKPALIGVEQPVDPGEHELVAVGTGKRGSARITLAEGETKTVDVALLDAPGAAPTAAGAEPSAPRGPASADQAEPSGGFPHATLGWIGIGVGAAGLGLGVVTGLMATSKHSSAKEGCPEGKCAEGSTAADDMESFRSLRTFSTIGYAVGIIGVAAGAGLLLTAPAQPSASHVSPFVGIGTAGVAGRF
jgi:hypothetical protein